MHNAPTEHEDQTSPDHEKPHALSAHDPSHDTDTSRTPLRLIMAVVLVVTGVVVLHLTGLVGPGAH
jgi:hypothetical protein